MPNVVSNPSPLIHFSKIGLLDILNELFDEVIPGAVFYRCVVEDGTAEERR
ncbi:MAG: hypothetical protein R6W73_01060 [Candidatus Saliniplasma sp.]